MTNDPSPKLYNYNTGPDTFSDTLSNLKAFPSLDFGAIPINKHELRRSRCWHYYSK